MVNQNGIQFFNKIRMGDPTPILFLYYHLKLIYKVQKIMHETVCVVAKIIRGCTIKTFKVKFWFGIYRREDIESLKFLSLLSKIPYEKISDKNSKDFCQDMQKQNSTLKFFLWFTLYNKIINSRRPCLLSRRS